MGMYGAASPRRRPPPHPPWYAPAPSPQARPLVPAQQTVTCHPRNSAPKPGLSPWQTGGPGGITHNHGTTRQGTTRAGCGRITHTGNHRAPSPSPPFDSQMRMMGMMLCTMMLMCYIQCGCWWYLCSYVALGFGTACSLLYLVENRAWLVMFLRKLYRPLSFQAKFRLGSLKVSLSTCLNDFHSELLSKGPEESADGAHDHHFRHHHYHHIHQYHWLWSSGQVGVQWNCITS